MLLLPLEALTSDLLTFTKTLTSDAGTSHVIFPPPQTHLPLSLPLLKVCLCSCVSVGLCEMFVFFSLSSYLPPSRFLLDCCWITAAPSVRLCSHLGHRSAKQMAHTVIVNDPCSLLGPHIMTVGVSL